jgi:carbonic anhydrase
MKQLFSEVLEGYQAFRNKYVLGDNSIMQHLANHGQKPEIMMVACCDSRVDPALILQCAPGDLFVARNVANIVPPFEKDGAHHGTSAALEFGICFLEVKHLIILGHSQCGGIKALLNGDSLHQDDFITDWVSLIQAPESDGLGDIDSCAKLALTQSYQHCLTFPWIKERVMQKKLAIHRWFFDISAGLMSTYCDIEKKFQLLS